MEIVHPLVLVLAVIAILLIFWRTKKQKVYKDGKKVANTKETKELPYYQSILKRYKILKILINTSCILAILLASLLVARPATEETSSSVSYNRDIFLCMDVSTSVNELNEGLVANLKKTVKDLKGERFGVSIFNTSSVLMVPLTDDYEYVLSILDNIEEGLKESNRELTDSDYDKILSGDWSAGKDYDKVNYIQYGTLEGNELRGSSLIGDGLASCIYSFSGLEEEKNRTRVIIFSTDNELAGTEIVTLKEAGELAKQYGITIYGIAPSTIRSSDEAGLRRAVETSGGILYKEGNGATAASIVKEIEKKQKNKTKKPQESRLIDHPEVPLVILTLSVFTLFFVNKKVKL